MRLQLQDDAWVFYCKAPNDLRGVIAGSVIDDSDLEAVDEQREVSPEDFECRTDSSSLVESRNDDRELDSAAARCRRGDLKVIIRQAVYRQQQQRRCDKSLRDRGSG